VTARLTGTCSNHLSYEGTPISLPQISKLVLPEKIGLSLRPRQVEAAGVEPIYAEERIARSSLLKGRGADTAQRQEPQPQT
jgi:hypothetical protein